MRSFFVLTMMLLPGRIWSAEPPVADRWAVLIGVDDYANANDLRFCGADQTAFRDRLIAAGFRPENIALLHDKAAESKYHPSRGNIEQQLRLTIHNAETDDLLVVGFSGHGVSVDGKSYLCPSEAMLGDAATLISLDDVYDQLRDCSARFKLVVVDACRNDPALGGKRSLSATEGTRQLARSLQELRLPQGVVLLNSCAPGEVSWEETEFGHGVFMKYVLDGMQGSADGDADGAVSLNELQRYAAGRTKAYVTSKFNSTQRPFFRSEGEAETLDFPLWAVGADIFKPYAGHDIRPPLHPAGPETRNVRPFLGVTLDSRFNDEAARQLGLPKMMGTRVLRISPGSPADGLLMVDDVILRFDGVNVKSDDHLVLSVIRETSINVSIPMTVFRNEKLVELSTKLLDFDTWLKLNAK